MSGNYLFKNPVTPFSNIDLNVASNGTHNPSNFGSIETSLEFGLPNNFRNNMSAANASRLSGGRRTKKNIKRNNMGGKRRLRTRRVKSRRGLKRRRTNKRGRVQKGGNNSYHQFGSQIPVNASYGIDTKLSPYLSGLANPIPIKNISGVIDNYNYNTNKGFQFW